MRRGTPSAYARRTHSTWKAQLAPPCRGHVLHSVQRPVHVYPHSTRGAQAPRGGAITSVSRSGKPASAGGTGTGAAAIGRMRGSPRVTAFWATREARRDATEKEGGHGHRPCEESRAPSSASVRRLQLQKSAGSVLVSNKLACSAPKRAAVRVNRGLGGTAGDLRGTRRVRRMERWGLGVGRSSSGP